MENEIEKTSGKKAIVMTLIVFIIFVIVGALWSKIS